MLSSSVLLSKVREFGPFADEAGAKRAMRAALETLGEQLTRDEIAWLNRELDDELGRILASWSRQGDEPTLHRDSHEFVRRVASREAVWTGLASEHAEVVLGALGHSLPPTVVQRLTKHLPELAELLHWRKRSLSSLGPRHPQSDSSRDLASGRPGGTHPLATSDTRTLAHRHSVARSDNPHADTKLSSARGLSQEREGHTLADGHPGADNPVSRGR